MAGVQFGFAAGEGSASTPETLLQSRRVSSSAGYRVSSLGFRSPLTSCCSISSGFSSSFFFLEVIPQWESVPCFWLLLP